MWAKEEGDSLIASLHVVAGTPQCLQTSVTFSNQSTRRPLGWFEE